MSTYISFHPLDYDFAYKLLIHIRNLGHKTEFFVPKFYENTDQNNIKRDKFIAILRPEYLQSQDYLAVVNIVDTISGFFPVLRVPISIDEWSSNVVFRPVVDFTSRDASTIEMKLKSLSDMLVGDDDNLFATPTAKEIHLNNLGVMLQSYNRPLASLEYINYPSGSVNELPLDHLLQKIRFKIESVSKHKQRPDSYSRIRKDFLKDIVEHFRSFIVVCNNIDRSSLICHLVNMAKEHAEVDVNAPIPIFLDVENWPSDSNWTDWLISRINFSDTPLDDIDSGKCTIYACGLDQTWFRSHPLKNSFDEWLHSTSPSRHLIIVCSHMGNLDDYSPIDTIVNPVETNIAQFREICQEYPNRAFGQFVIKSTESNINIPAFNYLLQNPVLAATLLSVKFDDETDFEQFGVIEYFQIVIKNLRQIGTMRHHEAQEDFTLTENFLLKLAALSIEQEKVNFICSNIEIMIPTKLTVTNCVDADFLVINDNTIRFSIPMLQDYFAAKALAQFGIPTQLPNLALDKSFHRISQRWDKPIIISNHLSNRRDNALKRIAKSDPLLALLCIKSGIPVSASLYSFVIEQNLSSLVTLGDFRVDFATLLYSIDPNTAKAILIEILRDAHWSVRLDAFAAFIELDTSFLPGLAKAIAEISEDTRDHISKVLHRLGADALSTLFVLLRKDNPELRLNAAWALGELQDKACVPALVEVLRDNDLGVSKQVVMSLALLQDINCVPYLVKYLNIYRMQNTIGATLSHLQNNLPEQFISLLQKMDATAKRSVIQILQDAMSNNLVDFLLEMSRDTNVDVRLAAIKRLGAYPEARVITRLEDCLDDMTKSRLNKSTVSEMVSKVLSNIQKAEEPMSNHNNVTDNTKSMKSSEIVKARLLQVKENRAKEDDKDAEFDNLLVKINKPVIPSSGYSPSVADDSYVSAILEQLRERKWTSSSNAAKTLREYVKELHGTTSLNVINQILETLNDADWVIRWTGVETLGWTGNVHVVPHLIQRLTDNNWKVRIAAIRSLSEIGDNTAVAGLSALLSDNNAVVREAAAEALGLLDGKEALQALESATVDQEDFVRLAAVESLGRMHQKAAIKSLLSALKDKSEHVRWAAANSLSGMASAEMVPSLIPSLSDTAGPYWEQKRICDVIVDILKQIGSDEALSAIAGWGNSQ